MCDLSSTSLYLGVGAGLTIALSPLRFLLRFEFAHRKSLLLEQLMSHFLFASDSRQVQLRFVLSVMVLWIYILLCFHAFTLAARIHAHSIRCSLMFCVKRMAVFPYLGFVRLVRLCDSGFGDFLTPPSLTFYV